MGEGETPEQRGIDSLKDRTKKVLCFLKIMYHLHIWKQKHRETIFKAPEKYSKRFQRAMSSASNVSTSSKDIKFPETFFVFLLEKEEFSPFCWDKIETIKNDPSTNTFYLQGHIFFLRTPDLCCFCLEGKSEGVFSQSLLILHSRKLAKDIPKKHRPVVGRVYTPEFTYQFIGGFSPRWRLTTLNLIEIWPKKNPSSLIWQIPLLVWWLSVFVNFSFHQNLNFVLVFCEQILTKSTRSRNAVQNTTTRPLEPFILPK